MARHAVATLLGATQAYVYLRISDRAAPPDAVLVSRMLSSGRPDPIGIQSRPFGIASASFKTVYEAAFLVKQLSR